MARPCEWHIVVELRDVDGDIADTESFEIVSRNQKGAESALVAALYHITVNPATDVGTFYAIAVMAEYPVMSGAYRDYWCPAEAAADDAPMEIPAYIRAGLEAVFPDPSKCSTTPVVEGAP